MKTNSRAAADDGINYGEGYQVRMQRIGLQLKVVDKDGLPGRGSTVCKPAVRAIAATFSAPVARSRAPRSRTWSRTCHGRARRELLRIRRRWWICRRRGMGWVASRIKMLQVAAENAAAIKANAEIMCGGLGREAGPLERLTAEAIAGLHLKAKRKRDAGKSDLAELRAAAILTRDSVFRSRHPVAAPSAATAPSK